jgi:hypothetical protein
MQNRKFRTLKLGQNVCGNSNCTFETHSKALLPVTILETALFAALVIYDQLLEFIVRGEKCIFVDFYVLLTVLPSRYNSCK